LLLLVCVRWHLSWVLTSAFQSKKKKTQTKQGPHKDDLLKKALVCLPKYLSQVSTQKSADKIKSLCSTNPEAMIDDSEGKKEAKAQSPEIIDLDNDEQEGQLT
jgi:hypothetical protein